MSEFVIQEGELAGFDLAGTRQSNGTIKLWGSRRIITDWPEEIPMLGETYTLEYVTPGDDGHESAVYV